MAQLGVMRRAVLALTGSNSSSSSPHQQDSQSQVLRCNLVGKCTHSATRFVGLRSFSQTQLATLHLQTGQRGPTEGIVGAALQGEVLVAALFCLTAWRAFYSAFRAWSNLM